MTVLEKQNNTLELSELVSLTNTNMLYTWLKYADDEKGSNMSDDPQGKNYVGLAYNKKTLKESTNPLDYKWSRIKGDKGEMGPDGIPGPPGTSGKTTYFHIKYSHLPNPSNPEDMSELPSTYIGTYVDFVEKDSDDPRRYKWHRLEGIQGPRGEQGVPGGIGPDGKPTYLHIKYSDDGGKTFTAANGETPGSWLGQYVDNTLKDSPDPKRYKWSKIKGEDGRAFTVKGQFSTTDELFAITGKEGEAYIVQGNLWGWVVTPNGRGSWVNLGRIKGEDGKPGITLYTWIKYADNDKGKGMSDNPQGKKYIGVAYNKTSIIEINDYTLYNWSKIQADDFTIAGTLPSKDKLPGVGTPGTCYIINGELWSWKIDPLTGVGSWANMGQFIGGSTVMADRSIESMQWSTLQGLVNKPKTWSGVNNWNKIIKGDILIVPIKVTDKKNAIGHVYCNITQQPTNSNVATFVKSVQMGPEGPQGQQGLAGLQGPKGENGLPGKPGTSSYFHIKYSKKSKPQYSHDMTEVPSEYIGTYVDNLQVDSQDPDKYTWYRFQGLQGPKGENGLPGGIGPDGKPSYLHIKYSDDGGKTFTGNNGENPGKYIGQYVDSTQKDSMEPNSYKWSLIKGGSIIIADTPRRRKTWKEIQELVGTLYTWYEINNWTSMDKGDIIIIPIEVSDKKNAICNVYCGLAYKPNRDYIYVTILEAQMGPEGPQGPIGPEGPRLDWINDWDGKKVTIGGAKVITPKIFAGRLDNVSENGAIVKKPTGIAMGQQCFGTLNGFQNMAGLCAYNKGAQTFSIDTQGQVFFGDPSGRNGLISYKNGNLSISAPTITLGTRDLKDLVEEQGRKAVSATVTVNDNGLSVNNGVVNIVSGSTTIFSADKSGNLKIKGQFEAGNNEGKIKMKNTNLYGFSKANYLTPVYASGVWHPDGNEKQPLAGYVSTSITNAELSDDEGALYMSGVKGASWDGNLRGRIRYTRNQAQVYEDIEFGKYGTLSFITNSPGNARLGFYLSADGYICPYRGDEYIGKTGERWKYGYYQNMNTVNLYYSNYSVVSLNALINDDNKDSSIPTKQEMVDYIKNVKIGLFDEANNGKENIKLLDGNVENVTCRPYLSDKTTRTTNKAISFIEKKTQGDGMVNVDVIAYMSALTITLQNTINELETLKEKIK